MSTERTPLDAEIRRRIAAAGPMPVSEFMALCLAHPQHGYYVTRDPIGADGDFTTAPEISQMFGELIGLWAAATWRQMGSPENIRIVELGPGRGTLMSDALRAVQVMPEFIAAAVVHLVEISPPLRTQQQQTLGGLATPVFWHDSLNDVPPGPTIVIANEFFDALPIHQAVRHDDGWHERTIAIAQDGRFIFAEAPEPIAHFERVVPQKLRSAPAGALYEWRSQNATIDVARRIARTPGVALIIDYGHAESGAGDTLQAVGGHAFADALSDPGLVDLTAHVDFQALGETADSIGAVVHGPITQAELLQRLGIQTRADTLKAGAPRAKANEITSALARLTGHGRTGMGELFKAMALTHKSVGTPPGF